MTRINVVPTKCLSDKHLLAEYRELPRIFTAVRKIYNNGGSVLTNNPYTGQYRLGTGHVKFFYNKVLWLTYRYEELIDELKHRGVQVNDELCDSIKSDLPSLISQDDQCKDYWQPKPEDMYLNMARLAKRSTGMPLVSDELRD